MSRIINGTEAKSSVLDVFKMGGDGCIGDGNFARIFGRLLRVIFSTLNVEGENFDIFFEIRGIFRSNYTKLS